MLFYPYQRQGGAGMDIRESSRASGTFSPPAAGRRTEDMIDRYLTAERCWRCTMADFAPYAW